MFQILTTYLVLAMVMLTASNLNSPKDGISFVIVGDFGYVKNITHASNLFDYISLMKETAVKGSTEDFDFFVTTGDNLYPKDSYEPTPEEFDTVMSLWTQRDAIKDLPIYPVRGNHDCYFNDQEREITLMEQYPNWKMEANYYEKVFDVGPTGEKFSLLQVDSCYLLCETVGQNKTKYYDRLDEESKEVFDTRCENQTFTPKSNEMMKWLDEVMLRQSLDPQIIWKASAMHHPMFAVHYADYDSIVSDFLPRLKKHNYDVYLNGHEHAMNYGTAPHNLTLDDSSNYMAEDSGCKNSSEWFPQNGAEKETRKYQATQGEELHQFTIGAGGHRLVQICQSGIDATKGQFQYAQDKYYAFALAKVTNKEFTIQYKGVTNDINPDEPFYKTLYKKALSYFIKQKPDPTKMIDLFEVSIKRNPLASQSSDSSDIITIQ